MKIKRLIIKPVKKLGTPVLSFKKTQETVIQNSQILAVFNGNLGAEIKTPKGIPLDYGSEFWDITGTKKLFHQQKDKEILVEIIQKVSRYHISPIEEATSKSDLEYMLLRGHHKSTRP